MAHRMSPTETTAFLMEGTRTGKLATVAADGRPLVVPIWFVVDDDGTLVFTCDGSSLKAKALQRDPRVAICVDDQQPPYSFVEVQGTVTISFDLDDLLTWSTRIAARYMGAEQADAFGQRNAVSGELLVRVTPTKVIALGDISG
jgi:PPOX class probable F420-dependent enzyme